MKGTWFDSKKKTSGRNDEQVSQEKVPGQVISLKYEVLG